MIMEHLTDLQVAALRERRSPPEEAFQLLGHAASCGRCHDRILSKAEIAFDMARLRNVLEPSHLSLDEINQLVEDSLPALELARVGEHLAECGSCSREVLQLREVAESERSGTSPRTEAPHRRTLTEWMTSLVTIPRMAFAAGAMVLFVAFGGWITLHHHSPTPTIAHMTAPAESKPAGDSSGKSQTVLQKATAQPPSTLAFVLLPSVSRGVSKEQSLRVPAEADLVRLTLASRSTLSPGKYLVSISGVAGQSVWAKEFAYGRAPRAISVELPAGLLSNGRYLLTLYAVESGGLKEDLDDYAFRVFR